MLHPLPLLFTVDSLTAHAHEVVARVDLDVGHAVLLHGIPGRDALIVMSGPFSNGTPLDIAVESTRCYAKLVALSGVPEPIIAILRLLGHPPVVHVRAPEDERADISLLPPRSEYRRIARTSRRRLAEEKDFLLGRVRSGEVTYAFLSMATCP